MANRTIPELTGAGTLAGTDVVHIVDGDGNSRKMTLAALKTFINTDPTVVPSSEPFRGARVRRSAAQSLANNSVAVISWQVEDQDTDAFWSAGAPTRFTIPTGVTRVAVWGQIGFASNSTGGRLVRVTKNGSPFNGSGEAVVTAAAISMRVPVYCEVEVTAGDYFELSAFQNSGGSLDVAEAAALDRTFFAIKVVEGSV